DRYCAGSNKGFGAVCVVPAMLDRSCERFGTAAERQNAFAVENFTSAMVAADRIEQLLGRVRSADPFVESLDLDGQALGTVFLFSSEWPIFGLGSLGDLIEVFNRFRVLFQ